MMRETLGRHAVVSDDPTAPIFPAGAGTPGWPIAYDPEFGGWLVRGTELARHVLSAEHLFALSAYERFPPDISGTHTFLLATDDEHRRLRQAMARSLAAERIRRAAREVFAPEAERLAGLLPTDEAIDLGERYVGPYAERALSRFVGITVEGARELAAAVKVAYRMCEEHGARSAHCSAAIGELHALAAEQVEAASADELTLLGFAARADNIDTELSVHERVCFMLAFFETLAVKVHRDLPATLLGLVTRLPVAAQQPLRSRRALSAAAHEAVRLQPGAMVPRTAAVDTELAGHHIRAGDLVILLIGEAGRDPQKFERPDEFDPWRGVAREHVGFGAGMHSCVGKHLAVALAVEPCLAILRRGSLNATGGGWLNARLDAHGFKPRHEGALGD